MSKTRIFLKSIMWFLFLIELINVMMKFQINFITLILTQFKINKYSNTNRLQHQSLNTSKTIQFN